MAVREAGSTWRGDADGVDRLVRELRSRWRAASLAAGWRFPSDWGLPEVDEVCLAVVSGRGMAGALDGLGRARARSGAGLDEALGDLAALHAVLESPSVGLVGADPDATPAPLLRVLALAWADAAMGEFGAVAATENLTGLATPEYLRVRLGEVYRAGLRCGVPAADTHVLIVVSVDLSRTAGWPRLMAMALVGDVLREVFDGGESLAVLGPSVAAVLAERGRGLAERAARTRALVAERFAVDPALRALRTPRLRVERLPCSEDVARELVDRLGRA
ncbi:GGDEF domain-containing protein [Actinokineospora sp. NPDC004072]